MKSVSIIKEHGQNEYRVVIVPNEVKEFLNKGIEVFVENSAGKNIGFSNSDYIDEGAKIVSREEAWHCSDFILKYKPPIREEYKYIRRGIHLGAIFHAEGNKELTSVLCKKNITAYSYEFFKTRDGLYPLAFVGGEIAGKLSVIYGAYHLQRHLGGSGILLADIIGVRKPKVIIIGYGNVGNAAIQVAKSLGLEVVVFGTNQEKMRRYNSSFGNDIKCLTFEKNIFAKEVLDADLVIGALLISTYNTQPMLTKDLVKKMKKGSMIIDVTCGYGIGYLPTFDKFTNPLKPVYEKYGVIHCKIDILPSTVPKTASIAFSKQAAQYLARLGKAIYGKKPYTIGECGKIVQNGKIVHPIVQSNLSYLK